MKGARGSRGVKGAGSRGARALEVRQLRAPEVGSEKHLKSGSEKHLKWRDLETADEVVIATAVGPIGLTAVGDALTGVWLRATKPCGPAPSRGVVAEAVRQLSAYF